MKSGLVPAPAESLKTIKRFKKRFYNIELSDVEERREYLLNIGDTQLQPLSDISQVVSGGSQLVRAVIHDGDAGPRPL